MIKYMQIPTPGHRTPNNAPILFFNPVQSQIAGVTRLTATMKLLYISLDGFLRGKRNLEHNGAVAALRSISLVVVVGIALPPAQPVLLANCSDNAKTSDLGLR